MNHTDEAITLAGEIAGEVYYPRVADAVALAIRYCALHATPLDDDQCTALYRATFEAGDGVMADIAHQVDLFAMRQVRA